MATHAQENSWGLDFLAPLGPTCHGMPMGGTHPLERMRGQVINPPTVGKVRQVVRQAASVSNGSTSLCLSHSFARQGNHSLGDTTLDSQISQDTNAPGWQSSAALSAASPASKKQSLSFKSTENQAVLRLTSGEL